MPDARLRQCQSPTAGRHLAGRVGNQAYWRGSTSWLSETVLEAVRSADVILAVGTRLGQSTTFFDNRLIPADAQIVQIDIDPKDIGRNFPLSVGIEGDAKAVLEALLTAVGHDGDPARLEWRRKVEEWVAARKRRLEAES